MMSLLILGRTVGGQVTETPHMTPAQLTRVDAAAVSAEAFVFAYPLVLMELMRIKMTSVPVPDQNTMRAPLNRLVQARGRPGACALGILGADTLVSSAWLDLAEEPVVLSVPETNGRYYVMSMVDMWTNAFASIGPRTTGTGAGAYAIGLGSAHTGRLPGGMMPITAPTRYVRIAGQACVDRGESDADAIQRGYDLAPLSRRPAAHEAAAAVTHGDESSLPAQLVDRLDAKAFFRIACRLLEDNPPRTEDRRLMERAHQIGLLTRCDDAWLGGDAELQRTVERGMSRGRAAVRRQATSIMGDPFEQWSIEYRWGDFGTDYLARAGAARASPRAQIPADALRALTRADAEGRPLGGSHRYVLRFGPGAAPPVHASWVLSAHPAIEGRSISLGDSDGLTVDGDGSLPIHIQHDRPARAQRSNWLPAPAGDFTLVLGLYWPREEVLTRRWTPPAVTRVD
jgi:hypothetical protein